MSLIVVIDEISKCAFAVMCYGWDSQDVAFHCGFTLAHFLDDLKILRGHFESPTCGGKSCDIFTRQDSSSHTL